MSLSYFQQRNRQREAEAVEFLGGKCVGCGTTENLTFHHIDPATKEFSIGNHLCIAWDRLVAELEKCELRCAACHGLRWGWLDEA